MALDDGLAGHWSPTLQTNKAFPLEDLTGSGFNSKGGETLSFIADAEGNGTHSIEATSSGEILIGTGSANFTGEYSFSAWIKPNVSLNTTHRLDMDTGAGRFIFSGAETAVGRRIAAWDGAWIDGTQELTAGDWSHLAIVANATETIFYINGTTVATERAYTPASGIYTDGLFQGAGNWFDSTRLYNRIITPAEVTQLYNGGRGEQFIAERQSYNALMGKGNQDSPPELMASYELQEDPTGGTAADSSGNNQDGTVTAGTVQTTGPKNYLPNAYNIEGSGGVDLPDVFSGNFSEAASAVSWSRLRTNTSASNRTIIASDFSDNRLFQRFSTLGLFTYRIGNGGDQTHGNVAAEQWYHRALIAGGGTFSEAIDGAMDVDASYSTFLEPTNLWFGRSTGGTNLLEGDVAGVALFNKKLSEAEAEQHRLGPEPYWSAPPSAPTGTLESGKPMFAQLDNIVDPNNGPLVGSYQWVRATDAAGTGEELITGATNSVYYPVDADSGYHLAVLTTVANDGGTDPAEINKRSAYTTAGVTISTLATGLIAVWSATLDPNKSGTFMTDLTSQGQSMDFRTGVPDWVSDTAGNGTHAMDIQTGEDLAATLVDGPLYQDAFAVSVWVKFRSFSGSTTGVFGFTNAGSSNQYAYIGLQDNASRAFANVRNFSNIFFDAGAPGLDTGWHLLIFNQSSSSERQIYFDGASVATDTQTATANATQSNVAMLGNFRTTSAAEFDGFADSCRLYNRALTPAEVTELFNAGRGEDFAPAPPADFLPHYAIKTTHVLG